MHKGMKRVLASAAVMVALSAGAIATAPAAQAVGPCTWSQNHYNTYTGYCPNGAQHYNATREWWQLWSTYHYGNFVRSYGTSSAPACYANEVSWGSVIY